MKYALIHNNKVSNVIVLLPYNADEYPNAVNVDGRPVQAGDTYDNGKFYREGVEVRTEIELRDITIDRMNEAGTAAMQSLKADPPVSAGIFTYGEWQPDTWYNAFTLFNHEGIAYFTRQGLTSSAVYPPGSPGTEALYGVRPSPDAEGIYPYVYNMRVDVGMKVRSKKDGTVYLCYADATDTLLYDPADVPAIFSQVPIN